MPCSILARARLTESADYYLGTTADQIAAQRAHEESDLLLHVGVGQ